MTTAADAASGETPKAVRPAISEASATPMPPGTGTMLDDEPGAGGDEEQLAEGQAGPVRGERGAEPERVEKLCAEAAAQHQEQLAAAWTGHAPEVVQPVHELWPYLLADGT